LQEAKTNRKKVNYYKGPDGYWHIYNIQTKQWTTQKEEPEIEKIEGNYIHKDRKSSKADDLAEVKEEKKENTVNKAIDKIISPEKLVYK
jgi:hypothetical protein